MKPQNRSQAALARSAYRVLMPDEPDKDTKHRLKHFIIWMVKTSRSWLELDLAAHRDYLLEEIELSPISVSAHLSTIRSRYRAILRNPETRQRLYRLTPPTASPADSKAFVDEVYYRIRQQIDPENAVVNMDEHQDKPDAMQLRLSAGQARKLMQRPGIDTLRGMRDTAIITLFLCTGIREAELCGIDVSDLRQKLDGELALYIRKGKGRKLRLIPYGDLDWALAFVDLWMSHAGIEYGPIFRGFYKGYHTLRSTRISKRTIGYTLNDYPIMIDGELRVVHPHDLRRTYARRLYDENVDMNRIRQNLGHSDMKTTLTYIGELDATQRRPPAIFDPPYNLKELKTP